MIPNDATQAQIRAADPENSTWVTANAGSGKTKVLTDRVARLLLGNVSPQRILCLTYTKAAASHMQNELFKRLGQWAMQPDDALRENLADLGEDAELTPGKLGQARTLFARALETPGGLKIQTIHSFCAALLRRFPLEAGVSPNFTEMDERSQRNLRENIAEALADHLAPEAFDGMATHETGSDLDRLMREIAANRDGFGAGIGQAEIWHEFGLAPDYDRDAYRRAVWRDGDAEAVRNLAAALEDGTDTDRKNNKKILSLNLFDPDYSALTELEEIFVYNEGTKNPNAPKHDRFPGKDIRTSYPNIVSHVHEIMSRFADARPRRLALVAAEKTLALHRFATVFLAEFDRRKSSLGLLDFDDLILRARKLLTTPGMAEWVLFKLDGGIDHILVDEAQDTSPAQWQVIAAIAEEFFAGKGARDVKRTLFVVGDEKQSIYSFQGADPQVFAEMRANFQERLNQAQSRLEHGQLLFSFRSSSAVLRLVDHVVKSSDMDKADDVLHRAFHHDRPGRVDLWPFLTPPEKPAPHDWWNPVDLPRPGDPAVELATGIARHVSALLKSKTLIPDKDGARPVTAGDILILVQRRSPVFAEIIRALKAEELPVAGADRLKVGGELAVRDLKALLSFLATPEDDLSLASALRSPLFGLGEDDLFRLAHGRSGHLWPELRKARQRHPEVLAILDDLLGQADYLRPYEILERILTRHCGRQNLIARLGAEAIDGIDAFLSMALDYERAEIPGLTGFLGWIDRDETDIKRQLDTRPTEIRVMTVHGAKGLDSPIVILPDTAKRKPPTNPKVLTLPSGTAAWALSGKAVPPNMAAASAARQRFQDLERQRLLYVALTRAETWLIVCGCGVQGKEGESWYSVVEGVMDGLETVPLDTVLGAGRRLSHGIWPQAAGQAAGQAFDRPAQMPDWIGQDAPTPERPPQPLIPSDLGGAKLVDGASTGADGEAARRRGREMHLLLEHLPGATDRLGLADSLLQDMAADVRAGMLEDASALIDDPRLAHLFNGSALNEVPFTASLGGVPVQGIIDLLLVEADRVLVVDFKTNALVPGEPAEVPEGLLRQMAAYVSALGQIYPDRRIEAAILWTSAARLMHLPHDMLEDALVRATAS